MQQGQRDWALLHGMKAGFEPAVVARMLVDKGHVDPMDPMSAADVLLRHTFIRESVELVASLVGCDDEKLAVLRNVCG